MGVDTSVLYLMRGGHMKKIIAIILVITMLACNSVNAASFVQDFFSEPMKQLGHSGIKKYIKISSASERLTQEIWENLD